FNSFWSTIANRITNSFSKRSSTRFNSPTTGSSSRRPSFVPCFIAYWPSRKCPYRCAWRLKPRLTNADFCKAQARDVKRQAFGRELSPVALPFPARRIGHSAAALQRTPPPLGLPGGCGGYDAPTTAYRLHPVVRGRVYQTTFGISIPRG